MTRTGAIAGSPLLVPLALNGSGGISAKFSTGLGHSGWQGLRVGLARAGIRRSRAPAPGKRTSRMQVTTVQGRPVALLCTITGTGALASSSRHGSILVSVTGRLSSPSDQAQHKRMSCRTYRRQLETSLEYTLPSCIQEHPPTLMGHCWEGGPRTPYL